MKNGARYLLACTLAAFLFCSCDDDEDDDVDPNVTNQTDVDFARMAAMSNMAEIAAGEIAAEKAEEPAIAQFGEMMVAEHTAAGNDLKALANDLRLYAPDSLDAAHQALKDSLTMLTGRAFDSVYIMSQVRDHQMAISLFQNEADKGQNTRLRQFATHTLPKLMMHHHHADSLANMFR